MQSEFVTFAATVGWGTLNTVHSSRTTEYSGIVTGLVAVAVWICTGASCGEELVAAGELVRVTAPVNLDLELAEITARVAAAGGPALLFDRSYYAPGATFSGGASAGALPAGSVEPGAGQGMPVVANLLGTESRVCRALGVPSLAALAERMANVARCGGPSWLDRLRGVGDVPPQEKFRPKLVRQGACQQVVRLGRDVDLSTLPAARCWPGETGPALCGRLLMAWPAGDATPSGPDPVSLRLARGIVAGRKQLLFSPLDAVGAPWRPAPATPQPAALILGGDPSGLLAASIDWAPIDGLTLAGMIRNHPWDVVSARSQPLHVPADAEMVIEGLLGPASAFGELEPTTGAGADGIRLADPATGYYRDPHAEPWAFEVTAVTHRASMIAPLWVVGDLDNGRPVGETASLQAVRRSLLVPLLSAAIPELVDAALPLAGGTAGMAALAIRKCAPGQARRAASALWSVAALEATKWVIVLDADVDPHDTRQVLARMAANVAPDRDIFFHAGGGDGCDHAAADGRLVARVGIDATAKLPGEHPRLWPAALERPRELVLGVSRRWAELGLPPRGESGSAPP